MKNPFRSGRLSIFRLLLIGIVLSSPFSAALLAQDDLEEHSGANETEKAEVKFTDTERAEAEAMVHRQFLEHLGRPPDPNALVAYTRHILEDGRDADWFAENLQSSEEGQLYAAKLRAERRRLIMESIRPYFPLVSALFMAIFLGFVISQVYLHTHRGMNYELSFMSTLVLLAPIVTLVMLYIRGDLVLSLGLIGSLSIIRFRTPIKDSRDMVFLFWTIAVGLGAGTYNWVPVLISSVIMVPLVFLLYGLRYGRSRYADFILVCSGHGQPPLDEIMETIQSDVSQTTMRSHEVEETQWETVFEIRGTESGGRVASGLVTRLRSLEGVGRVSMLSPKLDLPV